MIDKSLLTKRYYNISEVASLLGVTNSMLRYWEGEFKSIKPTKGRNGVRRYTAEDIEELEKIYDLVKNRGFTIDGARKALKKQPPPLTNKADIKKQLIQIKERVQRLRNQLNGDAVVPDSDTP